MEDDNEIFLPYTDGQTEVIRRTLGQMMDDNYDADDHLQPTRLLDMAWIDHDCMDFIMRKAKEFSLTGSEAVKVFRKRSSVSAFRVACLCYYLYALEMGFDPTTSGHDDDERHAELRGRARRFCSMIYRFMSEFIIGQMLRRWGNRFNELNSKRFEESRHDERHLYDMLTPEFTRDQLKLLIKQLGCTTPAKQFLWMWGPKKMDVIEIVDKDHFRKKS